MYLFLLNFKKLTIFKKNINFNNTFFYSIEDWIFIFIFIFSMYVCAFRCDILNAALWIIQAFKHMLQKLYSASFH